MNKALKLLLMGEKKKKPFGLLATSLILNKSRCRFL
tara:strand:- start:34 stop:141 length:108 start_codon:yes stop_codon:yes gene_type:complete